MHTKLFRAALIPFLVAGTFALGAEARIAFTHDHACTAVRDSNAALLKYLNVQLQQGTISRTPAQQAAVRQFIAGLQKTDDEVYQECTKG